MFIFFLNCQLTCNQYQQ